MLEQISPLIREVIEDLKQKNQPAGDAYETAVLERAFDKQDADGLVQMINAINAWYAKWQVDGQWLRIKAESPDLAEKITSTLGDVDAAFLKFKKGKSDWNAVIDSAHDYAESWRKIPELYPL